MREIKFRGRRIDNGEWVYGSLIKRKVNNHAEFFGENVCFIVEDINPIAMRRASMPEYDFRSVRVDPASIGQYTGLHDKNGTEIYEGDIVKLETVSKHRSIGVVRWTEFARYEFWHLRQDQGFALGQRFDETEVIGNIHENPELLSIPTPREQIPDGGIEE